MSQLKGSDKRRHERIKTTSRHIRDLSEGGAYIITDQPRPAGSLFHFEFRPEKDAEPIRALARVIRVLYRPNPKLKEPAGMAVKFTELGEDDLVRLREYLGYQKRREEIEGPGPVQDITGDK